MTPPRQILPNQLFDVTSRTLARAFRLVPSTAVNGLFRYLLATLSHKHGIVLYAAVQMANHYHLVGLDTLGRLPIFMQELNSLLARALNTLQGRDDKVWSGDGYGLVRPETADDLLKRIVYALANPCAADLVRRCDDYPGVVTRPAEIGSSQDVARPTYFFRSTGRMDTAATLRFEVPEAFSRLGKDGYAQLLRDELARVERAHETERRNAGRTVLGARRCMDAGTNRHATSWERWFALRPRVAAKVKELREAALRRLSEFHDSYRVALSRWRSAVRSQPPDSASVHGDGHEDPAQVVFPAGTWWMRRFAGVATE